MKKRMIFPMILLCYTLVTITCNSYQNIPFVKLSPNGHYSMVKALVFLPDNKELVSCSEDKTICIWDVFTGNLKRQFHGFSESGNEGTLRHIDITPDGKYLACAGIIGTDFINNGGIIRIIDYKTGKLFKLLKGHSSNIFSLTFSPDGKFLATGDGSGRIIIWKTDKWEKDKEYFIHDREVYDLDFSPDGIFLASCSYDKTIALYNIISGKNVAKVNNAHDHYVYNIDFSPNSLFIVSSGFDSKIKLWNSKKLTYIKTIKDVSDYNIGGIVKFYNNETIICGGGYVEFHKGKFVNSILLIDVNENNEDKFFRLHSNTIQNITISSNNEMIASTGGNNHEIFIWNPKKQSILQKIKGDGRPIMAVGFDEKNKKIYYGNTNFGITYKGTVPLESSFNLNMKSIKHNTDQLTYKWLKRNHNDKKLHYSGKSFDRTLYIGNKSIILPIENDEIRIFSYTNNGKFIIVGSAFGLYKIDATSLSIVNSFVGHEGAIFGIAISSDSKTLLSGGSDQMLRLWDIETCELLLTIFIGDDDEWVAWTPDGYYECSLNGGKYAGWHFNNKEYEDAEFYTLQQYSAVFYRPDIIEKSLNRIKPNMPTVTFDTKPPVIEKIMAGGKMISDNVNTLIVDKNLFEIEMISTGEYELKDVEVFVNGRVVAKRSGKKGKPRMKYSNNYKRLESNFTFLLTNEETNFRVFTKDEKGFTSEEKKIRVLYKGENVKPSFYKLDDKLEYPKLIDGTLHVIAFGVNEYKNHNMKKEGLGDLIYAEKDSENISELFRSQQSKFFKNVNIILLNKSSKQKDISVVDVYNAIQSINTILNKNDRIIVFLSSHGLMKEGKYYILTSESDPTSKDSLDKTAISWNKLGDKLKALNNAKEIVVMIDACHSGGVKALELGNKWRNKGVVLITSSREGQFSYENREWDNGAFTKAIVEGFDKVKTLHHAPADYSKDNVLIVGEVLKYAIDRVESMTNGDQTPWAPNYDTSIESKILGVAREL